MKKINIILLLGCILIGTSAMGVTDAYVFDNELQEAQFYNLVKELRCVVCQNQNLSESVAPLALDLKQKIYIMVQEQKTNQEIIDFMRVRYGDFVHYRPVFDMHTALLWLGPMIVLLTGLILIWKKIL